MAKINFKGNEINTSGNLPGIGEKAPDFTLTGSDLSEIRLEDYLGKRVIINVFPSIDTPVCAMSVRTFNEGINKYDNAVVICASRDLPFAHSRFCGTEGLDNMVSASEMKKLEFGNDYGLRMTQGPLEGLLARAVIGVDENGHVFYTQLAGEVTEEPDYQAVFEALDRLGKKSVKEPESSDVCLATSTAEHSRLTDDDEPCDDGRAG